MMFFTDASYSPQTGIGVIVVKQVVDNEEIDFVFHHQGIKNSELEKLGIDICVHSAVAAGMPAHIYTDCQSALSSYSNVPNATFHWIQGHLAKKDRTSAPDRYFRAVDLKARKELRRLLKERKKRMTAEDRVRALWTDLCPATAYWFYGLDNFASSVEMATNLAEYMGDLELEDFLHLCATGTMDMPLLNETMTRIITGCGSILFHDFVISKDDNRLPEYIAHTRQQLYEYAHTLDLHGKPYMKMSGEKLDRQIDSLLKRYVYFKLGQYYFYFVAFDDPQYDFDSRRNG